MLFAFTTCFKTIQTTLTNQSTESHVTWVTPVSRASYWCYVLWFVALLSLFRFIALSTLVAISQLILVDYHAFDVVMHFQHIGEKEREKY